MGIAHGDWCSTYQPSKGHRMVIWRLNTKRWLLNDRKTTKKDYEIDSSQMLDWPVCFPKKYSEGREYMKLMKGARYGPFDLVFSFTSMTLVHFLGARSTCSASLQSGF